MDNTPKRISFDGDGLKLDTAEDAEKICEKLVDSDYEILILQGNTIGPEAAERIGASLSQATNLKEAHFKDIFTGRGKEDLPVALEYLLGGIIKSQAKLVLLDLSDNALGPTGAPAVLKFLLSDSATDIEKLYINNCGWGPDGSCSLATGLSCLTKLKELICGRSRLENRGATAFAQSLMGLRSLEIMEFPQNGIYSKGIEKLAALAAQNQDTLKKLDLNDNTIKEEGCVFVSNTLRQLKSLEQLSLNDALLGNKGFLMICSTLMDAPYLGKMTKLSFEGNELSGQRVVDASIELYEKCDKNSCELIVLDNLFSKSELTRLMAHDIMADDPDDADYARSEDGECSDGDDEDNEETEPNTPEDESCDYKNGFLSEQDEIDYLVEAVQDIIVILNGQTPNNSRLNEAFNMINCSTLKDELKIQTICEELGLIKTEESGKKARLEKRAIDYFKNRLHDFPVPMSSRLNVALANH